MSIDGMRRSATAQGVEALPANSKRCPRCGELLFDDMDVCYGCLYDFTREPYRLPEGMIGSSVQPEREEQAGPPPNNSLVIEPEDPIAEREAAPISVPCGSAGMNKRLLIKTSELDLSLPLPARGLTMGRAPDNDVVLHTQRVGEYHLVLVPRTDDVVAVGLVDRAIEGTNSPAAEGCAFLRDGDRISVGGLSLGVY